MTDVLNNTSLNTADITSLEDPRFHLTGGLELPRAEGMETPTARKLRQILALLLIRAGQVVSIPTIAQELWSGHTPASRNTTIQSYVLKLRESLGDKRKHGRISRGDLVLQTTNTGYRLDIDPATVDALRFLEVVKAARLSPDDNEQGLRRTIALLRAASSFVRGPILPDVVCGPILSGFAAEYEETVRSARLRRIDACLMLGEHEDVVAELTRLTVMDPLLEDFVMRRMIALYRCGRTSETLRVYPAFRASLVRELGVEPSPQMRSLYQRMLRGDVGLLRGPWMI